MNIINLDSLLLIKKGNLPTCPAVYFVLSQKKEILYIGRADNLRNRWQNHHRFAQVNRSGTQIVWMEVADKSDLPEIERNLISVFKPLLNGTSVESASYAWAEDFVRELFTLHREGYINNAIAHDACLELMSLARKLRSS
jgi:excinuclease UvrABC nuclease subunit